jgi:hypothetical protein
MSLTKTAVSGAGFGSGSVSQKYGSPDPDPYQNVTVTDPQRCFYILVGRAVMSCPLIFSEFFLFCSCVVFKHNCESLHPGREEKGQQPQATDPAKKLRNLKKKLRDIEALEAKVI